MMSVVTAVLRADELSCDVLESEEHKHVAVWEKQGRVLVMNVVG